jgi:SAM-dependent methyltransferase
MGSYLRPLVSRGGGGTAEDSVNAEWARRSRHFPTSEDGAFLLHIGCGKVDAPGFVNLDARPLPHVHIVHEDLLNLPMVPDSTFDLVYLSHVLEHVGRTQVKDALRELLRVTKPGGVVRVSVPDFDHILSIYQASGNRIESMHGALMGGQDNPFNFHYAVFNKDYLRRCMLQAGFSSVREWDPDNCLYHDFDDWANGCVGVNGEQYPISLNLEAVR